MPGESRACCGIVAGSWTLDAVGSIAECQFGGEPAAAAPSADATAYMKKMGPAQISPLAFYLASEQNRSLFQTWGEVQIVLSILLFLLILFGTRLGKVPLAMSLLLVLVVVGERVLVTPELQVVGRMTDFTLDPSRRVRMAHEVLGYGYTVTETIRWALCAMIAGLLIWQKSIRSVDSGDEIDVIDKSHYRHINR